MARPTPFELVFEHLAEERFPPLREALTRDGHDPRDRDAFIMTREAAQLVRELRPDEGVGEAIDQLVALVHHAFLLWSAGALTLAVPDAELAALVAARAPLPPDDAALPAAWYVQLPPRRVWGEVVQGEPHEPLDGCFVHRAPGDALRVLGIFGVHPDRMGFSVVEAAGPLAAGLARPDGSALFAPRLQGGAAAGLYSIAGEEELLELGWRTRAVAAAAGIAGTP
jgi:hypothetical protein